MARGQGLSSRTTTLAIRVVRDLFVHAVRVMFTWAVCCNCYEQINDDDDDDDDDDDAWKRLLDIAVKTFLSGQGIP